MSLGFLPFVATIHSSFNTYYIVLLTTNAQVAYRKVPHTSLIVFIWFGVNGFDLSIISYYCTFLKNLVKYTIIVLEVYYIYHITVQIAQILRVLLFAMISVELIHLSLMEEKHALMLFLFLID